MKLSSEASTTTTSSAGDREVTRLIRAWQAGDAQAFDHLLPHVYAELRVMATRLLAGERASTLQPTELVHNVLLKVLGIDLLQVDDRAHFFHAFVRLMRHELVDRARAASADKRGAGWVRVDWADDQVPPLPDSIDAVRLGDALDDLEHVEPRLARIVELRYFVGLTMQEIATLLELDERTVYRDWAVARGWLREQLD